MPAPESPPQPTPATAPAPATEPAPDSQREAPPAPPARAALTGLRLSLVGIGLLAIFAVKELVFWDPPLTFTVGTEAEAGVLHDWESAPDDAELPLRFSDGTQVILQPTARARVVAIGRAGAQIVIESGRARVQVAPARFRVPGESPWRVHLGPFSVETESARFEVGWDAPRDDLELAVLDGRVDISGCDGARSQRLAAGQGLRASCRPERWTPVGAAEVTTDLAPAASSPATAAPATPSYAQPAPPQPAPPASSPADAPGTPNARGAAASGAR